MPVPPPPPKPTPHPRDHYTQCDPHRLDEKILENMEEEFGVYKVCTDDGRMVESSKPLKKKSKPRKRSKN